MERNVKEKYLNKKAQLLEERKTFLKGEPESFLARINTIKVENLELLDDYLSYLYMSALMMTSMDGYRKENNIPASVKDDAVLGHFMVENTKKKEIYDKLLADKPTLVDIAIYNLMQSESGFNYLAAQKNKLKSLERKKKGLKTTFRFTTTVPPIKELDGLTNDYYTLNLSELLMLKEKLMSLLKHLPELKKELEEYSPVTHSHNMEDSHSNIIERAFITISNFAFDEKDKNARKLSELMLEFSDSYQVYKSLKVKALFSKKAKLELDKLISNLINLCIQLFNTIKDSIITKYSQILPEFGTYFGTKINFEYLKDNFNWYLNDIDDFILKINEMITEVNKQIDILNFQKEQIDEKMQVVMSDISTKAGVKVTSAYELISKDPFESFKKVDIEQTTKEMDKDTISEIRSSYGTIADEYVYKIIPIK